MKKTNNISADAIIDFNSNLSNNILITFYTDSFKFEVETEHRNMGMGNRLQPEIIISNPDWKDVVYADLYPDGKFFTFNLIGPAFCDYPCVEIPKDLKEKIEKEFWEIFTEDFLNKELNEYLEEKNKLKEKATYNFFNYKQLTKK